MLTPKMSLRRNVILKNYAPVIQTMYQQQDGKLTLIISLSLALSLTRILA